MRISTYDKICMALQAGQVTNKYGILITRIYVQIYVHIRVL